MQTLYIRISHESLYNLDNHNLAMKTLNKVLPKKVTLLEEEHVYDEEEDDYYYLSHTSTVKKKELISSFSNNANYTIHLVSEKEGELETIAEALKEYFLCYLGLVDEEDLAYGNARYKEITSKPKKRKGFFQRSA